MNTSSSSSSSPKVSANEAVALAQIAFKAGRIFHCEGKGGGGKTSILKKDLAKAMEIPPERVYLLNMSGMGPQEMLGYGIVDNENRDLYFSKPEQWPHATAVGDDECLLILDEVTNWDHASLSLCRSLLDPVDGIPRIGTHELGSNVHICMTSNRAQDGSRSMVLDAPFVSRSLTVTLEPTLDGFLDWAATEGLASSPLYAFLKYSQGLNEVDHFNPELPKRWVGAPHPTPRSWHAALQLTQSEDELLADSTMLGLALKGLVGESAGLAATAFCYTISRYCTTVSDIRSGSEDLPSLDTTAQYAVIYAALRIARKESMKDPEAYVASGEADWLVEKIILPAKGELKRWAYCTASAIGIPLKNHPRRSAMQGA